MRIMAIDPGDKRIGVAISDPTLTLAQPLCTLEWGTRQVPDREAALRAVADLCSEHGVEVLVVGLARNMDGSLGPRARQALEWKAQLERLVSCRVETQDERLTTKMAEDALISQDYSRRRRKHRIDKLAAALILQTYLHRRISDGGDEA